MCRPAVRRAVTTLFSFEFSTWQLVELYNLITGGTRKQLFKMYDFEKLHRARVALLRARTRRARRLAGLVNFEQLRL